MKHMSENAGGRVLFQNRTFGVEEEFILVDPNSARPVAAAESSLARMRASLDAQGTSLTLELQQEQLEAVSPVCSTLDEVAAAVAQGRLLADRVARSVGARAVAMGTSTEAVPLHTVASPRYLQMASRFGITLKEQLTCGFHIHVSVVSAEEGVAVLDRIRVWLPVLLALSANSPFWRGSDSGYESFRYQVWNRWPSSGPSELFGSEAAYRDHVAALLQSGVLVDEGMIYFDARLSRNHPTVEVRIADVCLEASHAVALAAVVRGLVETAAREWRAGIPAPRVSAAQLRLAGWRASKSGIEGELVHPVLQRPCSAGEAVQDLLTWIRPVLAESGDESRVSAEVARILLRGTGSRRQRHIMTSTGCRKTVVMDAITQTHLATGGRANPPKSALFPAAAAAVPG